MSHPAILEAAQAIIDLTNGQTMDARKHLEKALSLIQPDAATPFMGLVPAQKPPQRQAPAPLFSPPSEGFVSKSFGSPKRYWSTKNDDVQENALASEIMERAFGPGGFERSRWAGERLGSNEILFGFIVLHGRFDIRAEEASKKWAETGRSVVVLLSRPAEYATLKIAQLQRPDNFVRQSEASLIIEASLNGTRHVLKATYIPGMSYGNMADSLVPYKLYLDDPRYGGPELLVTMKKLSP